MDLATLTCTIYQHAQHSCGKAFWFGFLSSSIMSYLLVVIFDVFFLITACGVCIRTWNHYRIVYLPTLLFMTMLHAFRASPQSSSIAPCSFHIASIHLHSLRTNIKSARNGWFNTPYSTSVYHYSVYRHLSALPYYSKKSFFHCL